MYWFHGNHQEIKKWRRQKSLENTYKKRPELLENKELSDKDKEILKQILNASSKDIEPMLFKR